MKKALTITILVTVLFSQLIFRANAQDNPMSDENNNTNFVIGLNMGYTPINSDHAGYLGITGGYKISENWEIGLKGTALWYDYRLTELDPDKTYHMEGGYASIYASYTFLRAGDFSFTLPLQLGSGTIFYKYDRKYLDDMLYKDEIIDRTDYSVIEPGLEIDYRMNNSWSFSANGSYRFTSPIRMLATSETILKNWSAGVSAKYNF